MSQLLISQYLNELAKLRQVSGTTRESVVREAFKDLLKAWGRSLELTFVPEYEVTTRAHERRYVDGALLHTLRVPFGYWEAKDEKDDLDAEIEAKFRRGYPKTNIIFEDSKQAVLIQNGTEVLRSDVQDVASLKKLITRFFDYERPEIEAFRHAVEQFAKDLPDVLAALRDMIEASHASQSTFRKAAGRFLKHAHDAINPTLTSADVREMLIQHILTGEVFAAVFPGTTYHEDNSIARELHKLEETFFTGNTKHKTLKGLAPYYAAIRKAAVEIATHHEKQTFLKAVYENFYKVYNPKAADRLGVVYTPNELVRFMIQSTDFLCERHFNRSLVDKDVDILDPATGTGTFVTELLEHFSGQRTKIERKYKMELHANEVSILPYYVANLNIEATYAAIMDRYEEFPGLCFVDTLDNTTPLRKNKGHMDDLFGTVSDENIKRIRNQNARRISVIIGNPPYNANQLNENENNKNRAYPEIDRRIKDTYVEASTAQKTKLYDMYARFYRWAADRLDQDGILSFVTNRSFIDSRTFDGFRKVCAKEFNEIWILDLGGDVRANPKLSGSTHNVFGIQTGVAICFMVRRAGVKGCRVFYARRPEFETAEEKLSFLSSTSLSDIEYETVTPDKKGNWLAIADNDFEALVPIASREAKRAKEDNPKVIFRTFMSGIKTNRDAWVYDFSADTLRAKTDFFHTELERVIAREESPAKALRIKWSRDLKLKAARGKNGVPRSGTQVVSLWRPFVKKYYWANKTLSDILTDLHFSAFGRNLDLENPTIAFLCVYSSNLLAALATRGPFDYCLLKKGNGGTESVPRWVFSQSGEKRDNITDWALEKFKKHYASELKAERRSVTKDDIFHYVYAVLNNPVYCETYAQNLRREFPRIPLYPDFLKWVEWGSALWTIHADFDRVEPWKLSRRERAGESKEFGTAQLRSDPKKGVIVIDRDTLLADVPQEAWAYKLGGRPALDWVLDQYRPAKLKDATIRQRFDVYKLPEYKEFAIGLIERVIAVSVRTHEIHEAMRSAFVRA